VGALLVGALLVGALPRHSRSATRSNGSPAATSSATSLPRYRTTPSLTVLTRVAMTKSMLAAGRGSVRGRDRRASRSSSSQS
jgi:hypothetical protein